MQYNQNDHGQEWLNSHEAPVQGPRQLDKSQKIAVAVLAFFALVVFSVWLVQTRKSLSMNQRPSSNQQLSQDCPGGNCELNSELSQRLKDTDKDGLSDYDELNVYNTSAYLEDSDSDGYSDKQEIDSQNDPNCPFGVQCHSEPIPADQNPIRTKSVDPSDAMKNLSEVDVLRRTLVEAGMDQEVLDQISDEVLLDTYKEVFEGEAKPEL